MSEPFPQINPKVAAIMAGFQMEKEMSETPTKKETKIAKAPKNVEEFIAMEGLKEWPDRLTSEGALDLQSEGLLLGTTEEIAEALRSAAPLGLFMLDDVEKRLDYLESKLLVYANEVLIEKEEKEMGVKLFHTPSRVFMTEVSESDALKTHHSSKRSKSVDLVESMLENRKKNIEFCAFPGFHHGELIELPGQLEAPPILHRVTKAQDFNPGFKKYWKKLFLSEASVALTQDAFWWIFLERFENTKKFKIDKNCVYDRMADSFVALFTSTNKDVKDKFLTAYPECLAQSLYVVFFEAFPESRAQWDNDFKQFLINMSHEWITGLKPPPNTWKNWRMRRLEIARSRRKEAEKSDNKAKDMQNSVLHKDVNYSLDFESFEKLVDKLGQESLMVRMSPHTAKSYNDGTTLVPASSVVLQSQTPKNRSESHQIGPGPEYERVKFNIEGRSPLISHYLHMRQLRDFHQPGKKVRRTEISKLPPPGQTYEQLIQNTLAMSEALNKEYHKLCDQTNQEILDLEKKQRDTNQEIYKLKKELAMTRNPVDLKILSERIVGLKDRGADSPLLTEKEANMLMSDDEDEEDS